MTSGRWPGNQPCPRCGHVADLLEMPHRGLTARSQQDDGKSFEELVEDKTVVKSLLCPKCAEFLVFDEGGRKWIAWPIGRLSMSAPPEMVGEVLKTKGNILPQMWTNLLAENRELLSTTDATTSP